MAFFLHFLVFLFSILAILGAIPELPADSCKEIKASEGGQVVSGKYWLNFIKPDTAVLAHCDMKTEGRVRQLNRMDMHQKVFCLTWKLMVSFSVRCNPFLLLVVNLIVCWKTWKRFLLCQRKFRIFLDRIRVFPWKLVMKQQGTFLSALTEQMTGS